MGAESIKGYVLFAAFLLYIETAHSLRCYQCSSTNNTHPFQCNEFLTSDIDIEPEPCDAVFGAQYCVKRTGRLEGASLDCYQCTSQNKWECGDSNLVKASLQPTNCSHIYDARYCVMSTGLYGDGVGTKRFCSANNLGNYCDDVKHVGDKLTYRTCVFTCTGDGCNPATSWRPTETTWMIPAGLLIANRLLFQR